MAEENDRSGRGADDEDDAEEEFDDTTYKTLKDAVLFAIDVSETMLQASYSSEDRKAAQDSPTTAALKCAYQLMQQRIISNPNDMMGILLFGTKESRFQGGNETGSGGLSYPHCYLLTDLDVPAASDVKRLRNLVEGGEEAASILVPSEESVSMANVLFCANQIFTTKAPNFSSRRLFLVTDNDDPHGNDKALRSAAAVRAKDLYDLGVTIELFPVAKPGHGFDRTAFYDDIVYRGPVTDLDAPAPVSSAAKPSGSGDGITLLQSLLSSINSKAAPRRALFSLPMEIGPNLKIGVKGYIMIKRQEPVRSCYVWLGGETVQLAVGSSTQIAEDTARNIESADVRRAYKFGGETVSFTPEELSAARYFGDPAIRIIGFKPLSTLPLWANVRPPIFVYPSETDYVGSTRTFSALHQSLLQNQKMALAWFIARKNAAPVIAALIPGAEKLNDSGEQVMPPGLWILPLPYADDIRQNPDTVLTKTSDTLTDMMRVVIQQLQLPKAQYDPLKYPNPALQWFYRILQAIALDEDLPDQPEDKTVPRYKQIDKRAGHYVIEWGQELEQEFQALHTAKFKGKSSNKRAVDGDTSTHTKRSKTANGAVPAHSSDAVDDSDMKMHYQKGSLNKLTVPILKEWASRKHISISGKKADVIERIEEYFEKK